jgi:phage-related protein
MPARGITGVIIMQFLPFADHRVLGARDTFERGVLSDGRRQPVGFGSGTIELVEDFDGDAYRAVYSVRFATAVYVLHAFKKKSKRVIKIPQTDIDLIKRRLRDAETVHNATKGARS